jgi:CHAT domain-containing protein/Tfp pilus assembly protein PilF
MFAHRTPLVLLLACLCLEAARGAGPPARLTPRQLREQAERNRLFARARSLADAGRTADAVAALRRGLEIERSLAGELRPSSADEVELLAELLQTREDFPAAIEARRQVLLLQRRRWGRRHWRTVDARLDLEDAILLSRLPRARRGQLKEARELSHRVYRLYRAGAYREALPLARRAARLFTEVLGEKHRDTTLALVNVAAQLGKLLRFDEADRFYRRSLAATTAVLGERHPRYAFLRQERGVTFLRAGQPARACEELERALEVRRRLLGERHPDCAQTLGFLSEAVEAVGDLARTLSLREESCRLYRVAYGEKHYRYAISLHNLALIHLRFGRFDRARTLLEESARLTRAHLGEKHPDYAESLNALGSVCREAGEFARARELYEQARDVFRDTVGARDPRYAGVLNNLATLAADENDLLGALKLLLRVRDIEVRVWGPNHPRLLSVHNNLACLLMDKGDAGAARRLFEEVLRRARKLGGEKHPQLASTLGNLAIQYDRLGDGWRALVLAEQAAAVSRRYGGNTAGYALRLANLAGMEERYGSLARARSLHERAWVTLRRELGPTHPRTLTQQINLALCRSGQGEHAAAEKLFTRALSLETHQLDAALATLSERRQLELLTLMRSNLHAYLNVGLAAGAGPGRLYREVLTWKGWVAARQRERRLEQQHPKLAPAFDRLRAARAGLADLGRETAPGDRDAWLARFEKLEKAKEAAEADLARQSAAFRVERERKSLTPALVARALPAGTALVDFLIYPHGAPDALRKKRRRLEDRLLAFVVPSGGEPVLFELGPMRPIERAIRGWRRTIQAFPPGPEEAGAAAELRRRVWHPLAKALAGAKTVLIAPDGLLAELPFAALPGAKPGSYLLEDVAVAYVHSGRHVLDLADRTAEGARGLLAVGGLDYGKPGAGGQSEELPGTRLEARQAVNLYRKRFPEGPTRLLQGAGIDKERLRRELTSGAGNPPWRYLHLATHGRFSRVEPSPHRLTLTREGFRLEATPEQWVGERTPLLLSGLVLAGANQAPARGLLTAEEVCGLDLRGCELVTLSACETALGTASFNEGVLGLQRSFHVAGARSLLSTLWSVSDPATSVLMEQFYQRLWGKQKVTKLEALRRAQLFVLRNPRAVAARAEQLRQAAGATAALRGVGRTAVLLPAGAKEGARSHPAWWAAFVLSGEWR